MPRRIAIAGVLLVVLGALAWWLPFLNEKRAVVTSTPSPGSASLLLDIPLRADRTACVKPVALDSDTELVQIVLRSKRDMTADLVLEASAPGYEQRVPVEAELTERLSSLQVPIDPPPRDLTGEICLRNEGRRAVQVVGTNNTVAIGVAQTYVDGEHLVGGAMALNLLEARPQSMLSRLGTITQRAADFSGGLTAGWITLVLVVVLIVGAPLAIFAAFWSVLRSDDRD